MREAVRRFAIAAAADDVEIVAGTLGDRAELLGALALAGQESKDPLTVPVSHSPIHEEEEEGDALTDHEGACRCRRSLALRVRRHRVRRRRQRQRWRRRKSGNKAQKVGVLLPDTKSSVRWESFDRPLLKEAFKDAGVPVKIQNAQGDKSTQQQQAEQMITNGAKVLLLVNLDSGSGAAIEANAKSRGVKVIDYDRLTLKGSADYYVSFDNVQVGKLQGQGLVDCLSDEGHKPEHRRAQRLADRQQRDPVQAGLRLGARTRCTSRARP